MYKGFVLRKSYSTDMKVTENVFELIGCLAIDNKARAFHLVDSLVRLQYPLKGCYGLFLKSKCAYFATVLCLQSDFILVNRVTVLL